MLIESYREETFGYVVIGSHGEVCLMKPEAKDQLKIGKLIDVNIYKPNKLKINVPFHLKSPLIVMLEVTKQCNLSCGHCYISADESRENEMSKNAIFRVLDELRKVEVSHIIITGGEPFLHRDIVDIINYADDSNFFILVVTNGTLLSENLLSQIRNRGHISFALSYLGGLKNRLNNEEAFNLLKDKINLLKKYKFNAMCWFCITKLNIDKIYNIAKWCLENGICTDYQDAMPIGRCKGNSSLVSDIDDVEESIQLFDNIRRFIINNKEKNFYKHIIEVETKDDKIDVFDICYGLERSVEACKGGRTFAYICSNGDVYPCSNCAGEGLFLAGNLNNNSFFDIWENSFKDIRTIEWSLFKGCKTCELSKNFVEEQYCKLRCPPLSKTLYNDPLYCGATDYAKAVSKARLTCLPQFDQL